MRYVSLSTADVTRHKIVLENVMTKFSSFTAAAAIVVASTVSGYAQENTSTSDPFVSTQNQAGSLLTIGGVEYVIVAVTLAGLVVALADGSSSSTSLIPSP